MIQKPLIVFANGVCFKLDKTTNLFKILFAQKPL